MSKHKCEVLTDFQHGGVQYFATESVFMDEGDAQWCADAGWVKSSTVKVSPKPAGEAKLEVNNLVVGGSATSPSPGVK